MYHGSSANNLTPSGSNSQRGGGPNHRKASLNLVQSRKQSIAYPMSSNVTPNFKTNTLGKKRTSVTTTSSPIPQPSYSQHVTPKHGTGIATHGYLVGPETT